MHTAYFAEVDHPDDVGVAKLCGELGLTLKTRDERRVLTERGKHPLQANALLESARRVARCFERLRHATYAEAAHQVIRTKLSRLTGHPLEH